MNVRWAAVLAASTLALAAACRSKPPPAIDVVRRGSDVVFRFGRCGQGEKVEDAARIMDLAVVEAGSGNPVCALVLTHDPRMTIAGEWRYGDVPAAYKKKKGCDPLGPGKYRIEVTRATLEFVVTPDGAVHAGATACR